MAGTFNNWKVVLLSLIGATTFWFFNALNKNYDARISYPVDFQFSRDSVVIMKPLPSTLSIDVSSGGWNLLRKTFWFNVTPIQVTLENPTEIGFLTRNSLLPIVSSQLNELKINYLVTDTVYIDIERKRVKKVKLRLDSTNVDFAENYRMTSSISINPDSVLLVVPQSCYDTLYRTYYLDLESRGISSDYNREVDIKLPHKNYTSSLPESVRVKFEVDKFERHSIEIPVEIINFPSDSSQMLATNTVQVFYTIQKSLEQDFQADDFVVTADLKTMKKKDSTVMAILVFQPVETLEIEVIPDNLKVVYAKK